MAALLILAKLVWKLPSLNEVLWRAGYELAAILAPFMDAAIVFLSALLAARLALHLVTKKQAF
jgi:hypothetical protein